MRGERPRPAGQLFSADADGRFWGGVWDVADASMDQATVTRIFWEAEGLEDEEIAARLEAALPAEARANYLLVRVEMLWPEAGR